MRDFDYHLKLLADFIGGFDSWEDLMTKSIKIRAHRDNVVHTIYYADFMSKTENELLQYIIDLLAATQIEASKEYVYDTIKNEGSIRSDLVDRINKINAELDILRGRVPTPKGYKIDINRAKELMAELKELTK